MQPAIQERLKRQPESGTVPRIMQDHFPSVRADNKSKVADLLRRLTKIDQHRRTADQCFTDVIPPCTAANARTDVMPPQHFKLAASHTRFGRYSRLNAQAAFRYALTAKRAQHPQARRTTRERPFLPAVGYGKLHGRQWPPSLVRFRTISVYAHCTRPRTAHDERRRRTRPESACAYVSGCPHLHASLRRSQARRLVSTRTYPVELHPRITPPPPASRLSRLQSSSLSSPVSTGSGSMGFFGLRSRHQFLLRLRARHHHERHSAPRLFRPVTRTLSLGSNA